jgi:uncharacterized protein YqgC (DUF456 family)
MVYSGVVFFDHQGTAVMPYLWAALLAVVVVLGWLLTVFGLPGNWVIVAATALYVLFSQADPPLSISWQTAACVAMLAGLGEVIELMAASLGATKAGASKRGSALALIGSIVGAIVGLFVGIPIPVIGSIAAALLFASVGAMAGAMLGETWKGRSLEDSWQVGKAAFWGRLFGSLAKAVVGLAMVVVVLAALLIS